MLDLDYEEDSEAEADSNFVLTGSGDIVEIQATGEKRGFSRAEFEALFDLARKGVGELLETAEGGDGVRRLQFKSPIQSGDDHLGGRSSGE